MAERILPGEEDARTMKAYDILSYLRGLFIGELEEKAYRIIVPLSSPASQHSLIRIAGAIAARNNGELLVMSVVEDRGKLSPEKVKQQKEELSAILEKSVEYGKHIGVRVEPLVFVAESAADMILTAVRAVDADLLVMGWKGGDGGDTFDSVLKKASCDVAVLMDRGLSRISHILVPYRGGFHAETSLRIAGNIAYFEGAKIRLLNVENPDRKENKVDRHGIMRLLERTVSRQGVHSDIRVVRERDVASSIIEHSERADLLIMSAGHDWRKGVALFGGIAYRVAKDSHCSVLLVRKYESPLVRHLRVMYKRHLYIHGKADTGLMGLADNADTIEELEALRESHENYIEALSRERELLKSAIKTEERSSVKEEMERELNGLKNRIETHTIELRKIDNLIKQRRKAENERKVYPEKGKDDNGGEHSKGNREKGSGDREEKAGGRKE